MNRELITYNDPKSPVSEMFKTLRTNIQFMNSDKQLKTLLVSSTLPGEGKSWTAANLAVTFAQAGKKVLIIDGDMRKGRQFNIFGVSPTPGLSNYLSGVYEENIDNSNIDNYIQKTEIDNLSVMTAGNVPPNPSELLVSEKMIELSKIVRQMFDITIFDGTPSLIVTDAPILARIVDSTIIVTAHNETKIDNVAKVKKAIESIGGKVAGVVVNKMPVSTKKYENTYYYGSTMPTVTKGKKKKHNKNHDSLWDETTTQTSTWNNSDTTDETTHESEPETVETATTWNDADSTNDNSIENEIKENWNQIEEQTWKTSENNSSTTENWNEDNESNTTDWQESTTNSLQDTLETVKSWSESNSTTTSDSWSENNSTITSDSWSESNSEATESWTENNSTEWEENEKIIDTTNLNNPSSEEWENDSWNEKVDESPLDWSNTDQESEPVAAEPILSWEQDETKNSNDTIFKSFENTESFNDSLNSYSFNDSNNNTSVDNSFGSETQNTNYNSSDVLESTQDVINQINKYLEEEKNKLKNGDVNG